MSGHHYTSLPGSRPLSGAWMRRALLLGASTAALQAFAGPALAQINVPSGDTPVQTAPADKGNAAVNDSASAAAAGAPKSVGTSVTSEVVVTGIRGSLQRDLNIKRNSLGIVDAISAEDIGKFPDNNIAEAIQRIPGVSVSRGASSIGGVPTSTGDATEITVRGFGPQFNETLYDDRQISSGTSDRGFDFSAVGADFVSEVDILKTPDATLSSGAIGATINIKYPKPFDHPGLRLVGSASAGYSPEDGHTTPNGGFLFSDTFLDNKFGLLVDVAYQDHKTRANHINNQGWEGTQIAPSQLAGAPAGASDTPSRNAWYIQDYGIYQEHTNTSREDARMVFQWRPQSNILVTVNDDFNIERVTQDNNAYSVWFNSAVNRSTNNYIQNATLDGHGTITSFMQPGSPTDFQAEINKEVLENNEYGFNAKWDVSNDFTVDFDADRAISWLNPNGQLSQIDSDVGYGNSSIGFNTPNTGIIVPNGNGNLPFPTAVGPNNNAANFNGAGLIGSHVFPISSNQNRDTVNQFKIQGNWHNEDTQIRFGVQYISDHDHLNAYNDFQNNDWQAYSGYGPLNASTTGVTLPQNLFTSSFSTSGFIPGYNNGSLPPSVLKFNPYSVLNYLQGLGNPHAKNIPGFNYAGVPAYNGMYQIVEVPGSFAQISNDVYAGYLTYSHKTELYNMPLQINIGLREELTHSVSAGLTQLPTQLTVQPGDHTAFNVSYTNTQPIRQGNFYDYLLPNIDLGLNVTPQIKVRLDASRTLTRPTLADLSPDVNITAQRVGSLASSSGNPTLQPYLSDNGDVGVEWYYQRNSYISLDGFVKHVTNFVIANASRESINGVVDPTTGAAAVFTNSSYVNGPSATIHGVELAVQHTFGETGFGFQANGTAVGSNRPYDPNNLTVSNFAVTGLADSANFVAFYDKNGFQARIAANWRDSYLDHFGQTQNGSAFGIEPTFVNANWTADFTTSYDISKQLTVYFEALNLTDSGYSTRGRFSNQFLDIISYGRRFTLGAHFRY
jgi:iron complex outermembrane recepter protein